MINNDVKTIAALIKDQTVVDTIAFGSCQVPDYLIYLLSEAIASKASIRVGVIGASLAGGGWHGGLNTLALRDQIDWIVGGYYGAVKIVADRASTDHITGYTLPQGVVAHAITTKDRTICTSIRIDTFIEPESRGGKLGGGGIVPSLVQRVDQSTLKYELPNSDIVLIRGKGITKDGKILLESDPIDLDLQDIIESELERKAHILVQVPDNMVFDAPGGYSRDIFAHIVFAPRSMHSSTYRNDYAIVENPRRLSRSIDSRFISEVFVPRVSGAKSTIIGIGLPVACINSLPKELDVGLCVESGNIGGTPIDGVGFGIFPGATRTISHKEMFESIWRGEIDHAVLGVGQYSKQMGIYIARLGSSVFGVGGFIDIVQSVRKITFCNRSGKKPTPNEEIAEWLCNSINSNQDVKVLSI